MMTPDQEIARYKKDFGEKQWDRLLAMPAFKKAVDEKDTVKVGEIGNREINGNFHSQEMASRLRAYE